MSASNTMDFGMQLVGGMARAYKYSAGVQNEVWKKQKIRQQHQIQDKKQEAQLPVPFILNKKIHVLFQTDPGPDTFYIIVSI